MKLTILDQNGKGAGTVDLNLEEIKVTTGLLHLAVLRAQGNGRQPIAKTKTRDERSGGGRKPWKQKGTGRARQGSIRSPQWKKGGVVHGPTANENYATRMPKSARRAAIRQALKVVIESERLHVVKELVLGAAKTKEFMSLLAALPSAGKRRVLVVLPTITPEFERASRNVQSVKLLEAARLNVPDLLRSDCILAVGETLQTIESTLADA